MVKVFLYVGFPVFQATGCLLSLQLAPLPPHSLLSPPSPQVFLHRDKFPLCPPGLSRLKQLQLSAFSHVTGAFSPLINFMVAHSTHFSMSTPVLYWEDTRIGHSAPDVILGPSGREELLPSVCWLYCLWVQEVVGLLCCEGMSVNRVQPVDH